MTVGGMGFIPERLLMMMMMMMMNTGVKIITHYSTNTSSFVGGILVGVSGILKLFVLIILLCQLRCAS